MHKIINMLLFCLVVFLSSFTFFRFGNDVIVKYGHIVEYRGHTIVVCGNWGCDTFDDFTFTYNNPTPTPIVEGRGVKILDCRWMDVCGLLEDYSTVPVLRAE